MVASCTGKCNRVGGPRASSTSKSTARSCRSTGEVRAGALDHGISDLRYEYHVLQVLEAHGIPVPHIYGFCDEPEGLLLARLPGRTEMVDAADDDERVALLDEYVEIMARMHAIPVADFEARGLRRPTTSDELGLADFDSWERVYRAKERGPAPMEEFGIRWIRRNMPPDRSKVCFVTADCGQFLFEHGRITAVFDFEFSYLGDPAADLAGLRCRDAAHTLGDMRRAIAKYSELTGDHIDPTCHRLPHRALRLGQPALARVDVRRSAEGDQLRPVQGLVRAVLDVVARRAGHADRRERRPAPHPRCAHRHRGVRRTS